MTLKPMLAAAALAVAPAAAGAVVVEIAPGGAETVAVGDFVTGTGLVTSGDSSVMFSLLAEDPLVVDFIAANLQPDSNTENDLVQVFINDVLRLEDDGEMASGDNRVFMLGQFPLEADDELTLSYSAGMVDDGEAARFDFSANVQPIPLPAAAWLLMGGLGGLGLMSRRRARA
jgi:hypothetical protein